MQTEENRNRMWTFILLYILGQNICQATEEYSTQMYYVKLTIDENAIDNITQLIQKPFVYDTNLQVNNLTITTTCQNVSNSTECTCKPGYRWSDSVCKSYQTCCRETCTFPQNSSHMCILNTSVAVNGSLILKGNTYANCLTDKSTIEFQTCNDNLTIQLKSVYSTLTGFDTLTILQYSVGSVIATFQMIIAYGVSPKDLIIKSSTLLNSSLSASLDLVTTGVVTLSMPNNPVYYDSNHSLTCTLQKDLDVIPTWQLNTTNNTFQITNGTGAVLTWTTRSTNIELKRITELWAGTYTCDYFQQLNSTSIRHQASALMDVCLLPKINIFLDPQFPHCKSDSDILTVTTTCQIESSTENYNVTWNTEKILSQLLPKNGSSGVYTVQTYVKCGDRNASPKVSCNFVNRCNQQRTASININIIQENDPFCEAELDWQDTKAGFSAVLQCKGSAGLRTRNCTTGSKWEKEVSACVNQILNNVLQSSIIVDIGLGTKDDNAANVLALFSNVTNNTQSINSFSNMNASVHVLLTLSQKQLNPNESAFKDFLVSSSNLLEKSLGNSWTGDNNENVSLAEKYLKSVEELINVSNITNAPKQTNIQVAVPNCSLPTNCISTVFNISVALNSQDRGNVKMSAFKELEQYFPTNSYLGETPNSHVVSATTERSLGPATVEITFPLLQPRPRNVIMTCVYWNFNTSTWSSDGCDWKGATNEGQCVCRHLSSFAILMSKKPLEITALTEITYAGLSISVLSLTITLVIELIVWSHVVKTNTLYLRHTAHVNISLCLLVADCCFLASSNPREITAIWCVTFVVVKHFCYLSMFFWMLCLSCTLLHQAVYLFHNVSKKNYLRFSLVVGYVCPLLIVVITFLTNNGDEGKYYTSETCWLVYSGLLKGSIYTFVIPVGIIVFVNVFSMLVVIMKLLDHPKNTEKSHEKEKKAALTVMRSVILLTPIFGVTWIFGFAVMLLDLTSGPVAYAANYAFTLLNAFQGLFILLTTCLGDKLTREALLKRLKCKVSALN
ncbi:adhesion G protein-coupled receptor F5 [Micropterus dolomieu]|uniref:adhesion G protein-coupled receptor F5 n=1 Tax=Micropterus dolomieu TaxID=147949 RepID=UPI001E8DD387|nr:adhesion G protein-coupled receptor F5 [Micropterus dolomieu]